MLNEQSGSKLSLLEEDLTKKMKKRKKIKPMTKEQLERLPTKRLLARLNRLHRCEDSFALSDYELDELMPAGFIQFKESPEWISEYNCLKEILAGREHVPRKN